MAEDAQALHLTLDNMLDSLDQLESVLAGVNKEDSSSLTLLQKAKQNVTLAYLIYDLVFVYLKLKGIDPITHPVTKELDTVKEYFAKISNASRGPAKEAKPTMTVDKDAAHRFITHAISSASASTPITTMTPHSEGRDSEASTSSQKLITDPYDEEAGSGKKRKRSLSKNARKRARRLIEQLSSVENSTAENSDANGGSEIDKLEEVIELKEDEETDEVPIEILEDGEDEGDLWGKLEAHQNISMDFEVPSEIHVDTGNKPKLSADYTIPTRKGEKKHFKEEKSEAAGQNDVESLQGNQTRVKSAGSVRNKRRQRAKKQHEEKERAAAIEREKERRENGVVIQDIEGKGKGSGKGSDKGPTGTRGEPVLID